MPTDKQLESYLTALDKALGQISVSDRADIVTEIKSHVLEAQERDPGQNLSDILASLGEPETVANRYLMERGLKLRKAPKAPIVKWLTIGFLGTLGIVSFTMMVLLWKFTPLISVDEKNERVKILGGLIDVDSDGEHIRIDSSLAGEMDGSYEKFHGMKSLDALKIKEIKILFSNGKIDMSASKDAQMKWDCKVKGGSKDSFLAEEKNAVVLNFDSAEGVKCDVVLPVHIKAFVKGKNGKLYVMKPQADMELSLDNGMVSVAPDSLKKYKFDLSLTNGRIDKFESSSDKDALQIKVSVHNGSIKKN